MSFDFTSKSQLEHAQSVFDFNDTNKLRAASQHAPDSEEGRAALQQAAKQFEAIFVQMLMKSMRKAQDALADKDSPFNSQQVSFYRDMHDQQLASDLSSNGSLGLADIIVRQLSPAQEGYLPASVVRNSSPHNIRIENTADSVLPSGEKAPLVRASKQSAFESPQEFVNQLIPSVKQAAERLGIEPKALLAQAALETGWGQKLIHNAEGENAHNLFGIKADNRWQGDKVTIDTLEFVHAQPQKQQASFRQYNDFADSLNDYVDFIKSNPRYQKAVSLVSDPAEYFSELQQAGYATDPDYAKKVMSVFSGKLLNELLP